MDIASTIDETPAQSFDANECIEELRILQSRADRSPANAANTIEALYTLEELRQLYVLAVGLELQERAKYPNLSYAERDALKAVFNDLYGWRVSFSRAMFHFVQDATNIISYFLAGKDRSSNWLYYVLTARV